MGDCLSGLVNGGVHSKEAVDHSIIADTLGGHTCRLKAMGGEGQQRMFNVLKVSARASPWASLSLSADIHLNVLNNS